jgi:hypothetical protein
MNARKEDRPTQALAGRVKLLSGLTAVISFVGKQILKYAKEPLGTIFFGWCLLYSQTMPRDFVRPTNTQIDKYK